MAKKSKLKTSYPVFHTPMGRLSWPSLFQKGNLSNKYETDLILQTEEDADKIRALVAKIGKENWPDGAPDEFHHPLKENTKQPEAGPYFITCRSTIKPAVLGPDKTLLEEDSPLVYGGAYAILAVTPAPYDFQGAGVTLRLGGVWVVKDGEAFGGGGNYAHSFDDLELPADAIEDASDW